MSRTSLLLLLAVAAFTASAQDVLTIGTGSAAPGGTASIPVSIVDRSGTLLGSDAGAGRRIQGFAFKVLFPSATVASVTFTRAGVAASLTPLYESTLSDSGWMSYVVSFHETTNPIPLLLDASVPGDQVGTLNVTLQAGAAIGTTAPLTLYPPSAFLSNQAGTFTESVAGGTLALRNGSMLTSLSAPTNLVAQASGTSQVNLTWSSVANADHYEVWRSFNGSAYAFLTNVSGLSHSDMSLAASTTYLYKVRAVNVSNNMSVFSNVDAATTVVFTDDPLVAESTLVMLAHITELRTAVNAFRTSASLPLLPSDPTIGAGLTILAQHIADLRVGLNYARSAAGLPALPFTDATLIPGATFRNCV
jgi:hypothetical protein